MDILPAFYEQLRKLRESGIKMKDLAEELDLTSSVLSSLYTSVLPTYMGQISAGKSNDEALDIARRILLVRQSEEIPLEEFAKLRTEVVPRQQLDKTLLPYYDYTCQPEDIVRSLMMASPGNALDNLIAEKQMLRIL